MLQGDALRDRAEVRAAIGRTEAAAKDLEQAIALFERKGIRVSADGARRSLNALRATA
jgi:hypothetical protein